MKTYLSSTMLLRLILGDLHASETVLLDNRLTDLSRGKSRRMSSGEEIWIFVGAVCVDSSVFRDERSPDVEFSIVEALMCPSSRDLLRTGFVVSRGAARRESN